MVSVVRDSGGCRRWWAGTVVRPPSMQVSSVVHASGHRHSILQVHLSSPLHLSVRAYSEQERQAGRAGWGRRRTYPPISRSQSRTSVNDTHPWKLYTPPGMCGVRRLCGDVMYVCHSKCRTDRDNAVRPLTLKPKLHVYDLFSTCWCAVFDLVFVQNGERRRFG